MRPDSRVAVLIILAALLGATAGLAAEPASAERGRAEMLFARGRLAWVDADAETALRLFEQARSAWPSDATYTFFAGHAAERLGRMDQARAAFEATLPPAESRIPEWRVRFDLGRRYYDDGQIEVAETHLRRALELKSDDAGTLFYLGLVLLDLERPAEAIPLFERARGRAPELKADTHYYVGVAALREEDPERARAEFNQVLEAGTRLIRHSIPELLANARRYLEQLDPSPGSPEGVKP
jgi:tetratricopeptide (TPR) repeat protein